jgi:hypothetical protein
MINRDEADLEMEIEATPDSFMDVFDEGYDREIY